MPLVHYDFETTGLNQFHDNITQYCFMKEQPFVQVLPTLTSYVNPEKPIPEIVTRITKITADTVKNFPNFNNQAAQILEFLGLSQEPTFFVAHNGDNFDFIIMREQFKKAGYNIRNFPIFSIDTLLLAKKLYPHLSKHNLGFLCQTFGIPNGNAHSAEADTEMVRNLYFHICSDLANIWGITESQVVENPQMVYNYINGID